MTTLAAISPRRIVGATRLEPAQAPRPVERSSVFDGVSRFSHEAPTVRLSATNVSTGDLSPAIRAHRALGDWLDDLVRTDPGVKVLMRAAADDALLGSADTRPHHTRVFQLGADVGLGADGFVSIHRAPRRSGEPLAETVDISFSPLSLGQLAAVGREDLERELTAALIDLRSATLLSPAPLAWRLLRAGTVTNPGRPRSEPWLAPQGTPESQRARLAEEIVSGLAALRAERRALATWLESLRADPRVEKLTHALGRIGPERHALHVVGGLALDSHGFVLLRHASDGLVFEPVTEDGLGAANFSRRQRHVIENALERLWLVFDFSDRDVRRLSNELVVESLGPS